MNARHAEITHPFYTLPRAVQWPLALVAFAMGYLPFFAALQVSWLWWTAPLWIPWLLLCFTPLMTLLGVYRYYGPFLLVMLPTRRRRELHNATLFDYLGLFRWSDRGRPARLRILAGFVEGLLEICDEVESGTVDPDAAIYGTSYFFDTRTANRLGFQLLRPSPFGWLAIGLGVVDITLMYSFGHGRLAIPPVHRTRLASTTGERLLLHRGELERLHRVLSRARAKHR